MIATIAGACGALAAAGCLYLVAAIAVVMRRQQPQAAQASPEAVTILKPLYGAEPRLAECLASFCAQRYSAPVEIVFGLQSREDPALAVANSMEPGAAASKIVIRVDERSHGKNAKISNLINMMASASHDILIAADSDILAPADYVEQVVALLQKPGAGAVSVLYYGEADGRVWSRCAALCINTHFLPNVLIGLASGLAKPCFGSTIALRRQTLKEIGGFEAFANHLADDYAIGAAVRGKGLSVEIGPSSVGHVCHEESLRDWLNHQLRWARTIRSIDLPGYLGSGVAHPFAWAALGAALGDATCLGLAVLALALRAGLCNTVERSFKLRGQDYWLLPLTDLISFGVFVRSFFGANVIWKRASFTVLGDGTLAQPREESP